MVLLTPRRDLTAAERASAIETLACAAADVPEIARFRIGRRVTHGLPGYEQQMKQDYEIVLLVEVEDLAALKRYLHAPAHAALGRLFGSATSAAVAYDYEIAEASAAAGLLMPKP